MYFDKNLNNFVPFDAFPSKKNVGFGKTVEVVTIYFQLRVERTAIDKHNNKNHKIEQKQSNEESSAN